MRHEHEVACEMRPSPMIRLPSSPGALWHNNETPPTLTCSGLGSLRPPAMLYHLMASQFASLVYMGRMRKGRGKELLHTYIAELSLATQNGPKFPARNSIHAALKHQKRNGPKHRSPIMLSQFACHLYIRTQEFEAVLGSSSLRISIHA